MTKATFINECKKCSNFIWDWMKTADNIPHGRVDERGVTAYIMTKLENAKARIFTFRDSGAVEL